MEYLFTFIVFTFVLLSAGLGIAQNHNALDFDGTDDYVSIRRP